MKKWLVWIIVLIILVALLFTGYFLVSSKFNSATDNVGLHNEIPPCNDDLVNCDDFYSQEDAQQAYDSCMEEVGYDVHRLDNDGDGIVCEGLS